MTKCKSCEDAKERENDAWRIATKLTDKWKKNEKQIAELNNQIKRMKEAEDIASKLHAKCAIKADKQTREIEKLKAELKSEGKTCDNLFIQVEAYILF